MWGLITSRKWRVEEPRLRSGETPRKSRRIRRSRVASARNTGPKSNPHRIRQGAASLRSIAANRKTRSYAISRAYVLHWVMIEKTTEWEPRFAALLAKEQGATDAAH